MMHKTIIFISSLSLLISCNSRNEKKEASIIEKDKNNINAEKKERNALFISENGPIQKYTIKSDEKAIITGQKGTIIEINENTFNIKPSLISVNLIECYSLDDILFNNLLTVTESKKLLQTQGMIYLKFKDVNGKELEPENSKLTIKFPVHYNSKSQLFQGERNEGFINWKLLERDVIEKKIEKEKSKGKLVKMPTFVSCVEKSNGIKICDTTYHLIDTTSTTYKNWVQVKTLTDGWLNLDHFIDENESILLKINKLTKSTIAIVIFEDSPVIYSAQISPNFANISIFNCNAQIIFVDVKDETHVNYFISNYKKDKTKELTLHFKTVTLNELKNVIKNKFGKRKVDGY